MAMCKIMKSYATKSETKNSWGLKMGHSTESAPKTAPGSLQQTDCQTVGMFDLLAQFSDST